MRKLEASLARLAGLRAVRIRAIFQVQSDLGTFDAYLNVRNFTCYKLDKAYYKKMHIYKAYLCNNKS